MIRLALAGGVMLLLGCSSQVESQLDRAQLEMSQGAYENAVATYAEVLKSVPNAASIHANMGYALSQLGRYDEALEHFRVAFEKSARQRVDVTLLHNWANTLEKVGKLDAAEAKYAEAAKADPGRATVFVNWGNVLVKLDRLDEAEQRYRHAVENDPQSVLGWFNHAYTLERLKRHDEALTSYRTFLRYSKGAPSDLLDHARHFVAQADAAGHREGS